VGGRIATVFALVLVTSALAIGRASADDPTAALRSAIDQTSQVRTARISLNQTTTAPTFVFSTTANGTVVDADHDLGTTRRIAKGTAVYEQTPADGVAPWKVGSRPAPAVTTPFGGLKLEDGTTLGDPKLFKSVVDKGAQPMTLTAATPARMLVGDLDMLAVATAMQLGPSERARMAQMTGTLTVWIGTDGKIARNVLTIIVPSSDGPMTLTTTLDLYDLNTALTIAAP
jgi:hypothetical protein